MAEQGTEKRRYGRESVMDGEMQRCNTGADGDAREEISALYSLSSLLLLFHQGLQSSDGTPQIQGRPSPSYSSRTP